MKHIMEHYGTAIITGVILVALGLTLVTLAKSTWIVSQFQTALTSFMGNMTDLSAGANAPTIPLN